MTLELFLRIMLGVIALTAAIFAVALFTMEGPNRLFTFAMSAPIAVVAGLAGWTAIAGRFGE